MGFGDIFHVFFTYVIFKRSAISFLIRFSRSVTHPHPSMIHVCQTFVTLARYRDKMLQKVIRPKTNLDLVTVLLPKREDKKQIKSSPLYLILMRRITGSVARFASDLSLFNLLKRKRLTSNLKQFIKPNIYGLGLSSFRRFLVFGRCCSFA